MFQMIFLEAKRFFQAFQLHTNDERRQADGFFGGNGLSWVKQLGPGLAVSALDTRTERTRAQIIPMKRMDELSARVRVSLSLLASLFLPHFSCRFARLCLSLLASASLLFSCLCLSLPAQCHQCLMLVSIICRNYTQGEETSCEIQSPAASTLSCM